MPEDNIDVDSKQPFVSRGGLKMQRAFDSFPFDVTGRLVLDAGASTGGFTDCLLQHGAGQVIAVDVGYGQLDWKLRHDPRVEVLERTNIRYLRPDDLSEQPDCAVLDLSFISLKKVIPAVIECLKSGFEMVALVKPQFEAGRGKVGKGGVVRDINIHTQVLRDVWDYCVDAGCEVRGLAEAGIRGPKGNIEYLLYLVDGSGSGDRGRGRERNATIEALIKQVAGLATGDRGNSGS